MKKHQDCGSINSPMSVFGILVSTATLKHGTERRRSEEPKPVDLFLRSHHRSENEVLTRLNKAFSNDL
jgi:hypothetical protein